MRFWETPKYNSQELDKETGYYFYNARHYDASISRFVTPDTVIDGEMSTQGWNRYAYVHNNPVRYKDPTGHGVTDWINENISKPVGELGNKIGQAINESETIKSIHNTASKAAEWIDDENKAKAIGKAFLVSTGLTAINTVAAVAAPMTPTIAKATGETLLSKKGFDMALGGVQGVATYELTTPKEKKNGWDRAKATGVGVLTGLASNFIGNKLTSELPRAIKAIATATTNALGNYGGQRLSGKENKDVSVPSIIWSGATSAAGNLLGSVMNFSSSVADAVGNASMLLPSVCGSSMIDMAEKEIKNK